MLKIRNLSNQFQKRTIRPLYGQTQAYPYAATLDPRLRNSDGSFRAPLNGDTAANSGLARTAAAFVFQGGLVPGTVMAKAAGEGMVVHNGAASVQPFGLLANFVGGTLDDLQDNNEIGVWRGPDSVYELLFPAFDDTGLAAAYSAVSGATSAAGAPVALYAGQDGRLTIAANLPGGVATNQVQVARLIERTSAAKILVEVLI
jgi:hypothetical protein